MKVSQGLGLGLGLAVASLALAVASGFGALAADPAVVATAPSGVGAPALGAPPSGAATPANDATGSQIAGWIAADGAASQPGGDGPAPRTLHGEVGAGVGSDGYRNVYGVADIPVGQSSDLVVAASSTSGQIGGGQVGGGQVGGGQIGGGQVRVGRYGGAYGGGGGALALGFYSSGAPAAGPGCGRPMWAQAQGQASMSPGAADCSGEPQP